MILRVKAELIDEDTGAPFIGYNREEIVLMDLDEENPNLSAYVEVGEVLLDYLQDASMKIGQQVGRAARNLERLREQGGPS